MSSDAFGEVTIFVRAKSIVDVCASFVIRTCSTCLPIFAEPTAGRKKILVSRSTIICSRPSIISRLRLKVLLSEDDPHVQTVKTLWRTADWHERETYDLFGVIFDDHPDLRRIFLPSDFDGHALRKDYPFRGYEPYSMN